MTRPASSGPKPVAPFDIALINLKSGDAKTDAACEDLYAKADQGRARRSL